MSRHTRTLVDRNTVPGMPGYSPKEEIRTWGTHPADERGCEALSSLGHLMTSHMDTQTLHLKTNVLVNEPEHLGRVVKALGIAKDDISFLNN